VCAEGEAGKRGGGAPERRGVLDGVYSSAGSDSAPALHSPDGVTCARAPQDPCRPPAAGAAAVGAPPGLLTCSQQSSGAM